MNPKQEKELQKRNEQIKEKAKLFQVFNTPEGKALLSVLSDMCKEHEPTYVDHNPNGTAYNEGQRSIIIGIRKQLKKTFNEPKQLKAKVKEKR